jgi:MFS family permease
VLQLVGVVFFGLTIPLSAWLAERGRKPVMFGITALIAVFGLFLARLFAAGPGGALAMMVLGLALMGMTYGPLGTVVSELFPTSVRYTGSSLAFSMAGILGASLAPYIATWLANKYGLEFVGYYLTASAIVSFVGLLMIRETSGDDLTTGVVS